VPALKSASALHGDLILDFGEEQMDGSCPVGILSCASGMAEVNLEGIV
jgi:hypothetical protein